MGDQFVERGFAPRSDIPAVSAPSPCLSFSAADLISFFNVLYLMYEDAHSGTWLRERLLPNFIFN